MDSEEQRKAIAEACPSIAKIDDDGLAVWIKEEYNIVDGELHRVLFDPLNDLNAMHEAEKMLSPEMRYKYCLWLGPLTTERSFNVIHTTAAQRAEAFLHTIGKWTE